MSGYRAGLIVVLLLGLLGFVSPVLAQADPPLVAILTLDRLEPQAVGTPITITAHLVSERGRPVPNKVLILYVDGERIRQIRTDELGEANIRISRALPVGTYQIDVVFAGTAAYQAVSASMPLTVRPIQLAVETVPHIANVSFSLEGQMFVTNAQGLAQMEITQPGTYHLSVIDVTDMQVSADTRVSFSRWSDSTFQPERTLDVSGDLRLQIGFTTSHPIGLSFTDLSENAVDGARVSSVTLKRSDGSHFTFEDSQPQWLMATRVVRRPEGLEAAPLLYSVESVMVDGTNAVNRYQQRFYVEQEDTWEIQLLLYSAHIHATDAIFGFPIGRGVTLQYPDGHSADLPFGENRDVYQPSLARGLYHVRVKGVIGMVPLTPIALSKDQEVELKVLTGLDIGVGVVLGLVVALGLLFLKRPHLLTLLLGGLPRVPKPALQLGMAYAQTSEAAPRQLPVASTSPAPLTARPAVNVAVASTHGDRDTAWLAARLHPEGFRCPHCGHTEARIVRKNRRSGLKIYRCCACQNTYTLYTGTPFAGSRLTPAQSERLLREVSLNRAQLAQELGLTKKTVRKWQRRLQAAGELPEAGPSLTPKGALRHSVEEER
jgi:transposase-like protein